MAPKDIGSVLENINAWVWGPWTFFLFIGTGIFLTVRLKLLPWKNLGFSLRQVCSDIIHPRKGDGKNISPFQSLMTAMAAMMGTGNIAGVAAAMVLGGPGALIWMILSAFIAMALSLTENVLTMDCAEKKRQRTIFRRAHVCHGRTYSSPNTGEAPCRPVFFVYAGVPHLVWEI